MGAHRNSMPRASFREGGRGIEKVRASEEAHVRSRGVRLPPRNARAEMGVSGREGSVRESSAHFVEGKKRFDDDDFMNLGRVKS